MKHKARGKFLALFVALVFLSVFAAPSWATTLTWVDNGTYAPSGAVDENPITYTLTFGDPDAATGLVYSDATFTIDTTDDISPDWHVWLVAFKFSPKGGTISNLTWSASADLGPPPDVWNVISDTSPPESVPSKWDGFWANDISQPDYLTGGLPLTDGPDSYTWTFDITLDTRDDFNIFTESMPFQVVFSDGESGDSGQAETNRLSEDLTIPEPTTMLLLGSALIGLGLLGRRKFKI